MTKVRCQAEAIVSLLNCVIFLVIIWKELAGASTA